MFLVLPENKRRTWYYFPFFIEFTNQYDSFKTIVTRPLYFQMTDHPHVQSFTWAVCIGGYNFDRARPLSNTQPRFLAKIIIIDLAGQWHYGRNCRISSKNYVDFFPFILQIVIIFGVSTKKDKALWILWWNWVIFYRLSDQKPPIISWTILYQNGHKVWQEMSKIMTNLLDSVNSENAPFTFRENVINGYLIEFPVYFSARKKNLLQYCYGMLCTISKHVHIGFSKKGWFTK